ncbi:hypothetical protein RSAG8_12990, partial [Rhizoctonia solani AG-8 WAC10335]
MSRIIRGNSATEHEMEVPHVPALVSPSPSSPRSRGSSFEEVSSSPASPITPTGSINAKAYGQLGLMHTPDIVDPDLGPSLFSDDAGATGIAGDHIRLEEKEGGSRVRRLWSKVRKWRAPL